MNRIVDVKYFSKFCTKYKERNRVKYLFFLTFYEAIHKLSLIHISEPTRPY